MTEQGAPSPAQTSPVHRPPKASEGPILDFLDSILDWLEAAGFGWGWAERLTYWWKHFGGVKALSVAVAVFLPALKYAILPPIFSTVASSWAESRGIDLEVEDWSANLLDLRGTAEGITIRTRGSYGRPELLEADALTLDISLWNVLTFRPWIDEIEIRRPSVYVERLLSGRWNFEEVIDVQGAEEEPEQAPLDPELRRVRADLQQSDGGSRKPWRYHFPRVQVKDMRVQWVENLPAGSGGGVIRTAKGAIYLDDVALVAENVRAPEVGKGPTRFSIEGRTADGRISIAGIARPRSVEDEPQIKYAALSGVDPLPAPRLATSIYLDNVGAAAIATIAQPAIIVPKSGTVTGRIELAFYADRVRCAADVELTNLTYGLDSSETSLAATRARSLEREVGRLLVNGRFLAGCDSEAGNPNYRVAPAIQAAVTSEAVRQAPPVVRAAASFDRRRVNSAAPLTSQDFMEEMKQAGIEVAKAEVDRQIRQFLTEQTARQGKEQNNMLQRGLKRVRGWF